MDGKLDQQKFTNIMVTGMWLLLLPPLLLGFALMSLFPTERTVSEATLFGLPLLHAGDSFSTGIIAHGGMAIGLISVGGLSFGILSFGVGAGVIQVGFGPGLIAVGPCAFGVIAIGGASCGLIAIGGAATGYVAVGGAAYGKYVLAGGGRGTYVFDRRQQDPMAVAFFCRYIPRLKDALMG